MKRFLSSYGIRQELVKGSALFDVYNDCSTKILKDANTFVIYSNHYFPNLENITCELPNNPTPTTTVRRSSSVGRQQVCSYNKNITYGKVFYTKSVCDDLFYIIAIFPNKADDFVFQIKNNTCTKLNCNIQELLNKLLMLHNTIPPKPTIIVKRRRSATPLRR